MELPEIQLPGDDKLLSEFAIELADILVKQNAIFKVNNKVIINVSIRHGKKGEHDNIFREDETGNIYSYSRYITITEDRNIYPPKRCVATYDYIEPITFITYIEKYVKPFSLNRKGIKIKKSMNTAQVKKLFMSDQFMSNIPDIRNRIKVLQALEKE